MCFAISRDMVVRQWIISMVSGVRTYWVVRKKTKKNISHRLQQCQWFPDQRTLENHFDLSFGLSSRHRHQETDVILSTHLHFCMPKFIDDPFDVNTPAINGVRVTWAIFISKKTCGFNAAWFEFTDDAHGARTSLSQWLLNQRTQNGDMMQFDLKWNFGMCPWDCLRFIQQNKIYFNIRICIKTNRNKCIRIQAQTGVEFRKTDTRKKNLKLWAKRPAWHRISPR